MKPTYLGLRVGSRFKEKAISDPIIDRFEKKLSRWKSKHISKGGSFNSYQKCSLKYPILLSLSLSPR